jgi:hypothetical protein
MCLKHEHIAATDRFFESNKDLTICKVVSTGRHEFNPKVVSYGLCEFRM